jgi:hypothetical protein
VATQRRVQIDFEILLEYPLLDIDHGYIGPQHLPPLSGSLKDRLRDLQARWSDGVHADTDFDSDIALVEQQLAQELSGTEWSLVPIGAKTDVQRVRRRKRKR